MGFRKTNKTGEASPCMIIMNIYIHICIYIYRKHSILIIVYVYIYIYICDICVIFPWKSHEIWKISAPPSSSAPPSLRWSPGRFTGMGRAMGTSEISQIVSKIILGNRGDDMYKYIYIYIYTDMREAVSVNMLVKFICIELKSWWDFE